jgi:hypothetical protein
MSTELMWRACWLYTKFFEAYWNVPLTFVYADRRTTFDTGSRGAKIWKIWITYVFGCFILFLSSFATFAFASVGDYSAAFLCFLQAATSTMNIVFAYLVLVHGDRASSSINHLLTLELTMRSLQRKKLKTSALDRIGIALNIIVLILGCLPYLSFLTVPVYSIPYIFVDVKGVAKTIEFLVRRIFIFIVLIEICRTICGMLLAMIITVKIVQQISVDLRDMVQKQYYRFSQYINVYNGLIIILQQSIDFLGPAIAFLMTAGFGICVCSNFATLKVLPDTFPFPFFYIFPLLAIFTPLMISIVLPEGILCHELTDVLLVKWRSSVYSVWSNPSNRKYVVRRLRALRTLDVPVGIAGYNFFYIERDTKVSFYTSIMDNTVNAVLSYPDL